LDYMLGIFWLTERSVDLYALTQRLAGCIKVHMYIYIP
jgi:hypothetical protein